MARSPLAAALALGLAAGFVLPSASGQESSPAPDDIAATLDRVQVVGRARPLSDFPGAVSIVDGETLREGQRQVSLAESLGRVPGVTVLDRQNYAQDLQIQSRGFGARSTFGIRGIKLVVDGIPASAADGQGQAATFPLDTLDRIEVLRGPLALQYGNAAGGAIVGYTDLEAGDRQDLEAWVGSDDSYRLSARADGSASDDRLRWRAHSSRFSTDGQRPRSAAERTQFSAVAQWTPAAGGRLRVVANSLSQPDTQDPLGLTSQDWRRDPYGTAAVASIFDTRKRIENHQLGLGWRREYAPGREVWAGGYRIHRDVVQFLSIPVGAQRAPSSAGGVIDIERRSNGFDAGHRWSGQRGAVAVGVEVSRLDEGRWGYENFVADATGETVLGVRGRLRRDEDNRVDNRELYVIGDYQPAPGWNLLGAVRHAWLDFDSRDGFLANGDDSGGSRYRENAASLGVARAFGSGEVFGSLGRGFETPTITESAYRSDGGAGFNPDLVPATFESAELGARWRGDGTRASLAVYRVEGEDEIVPALSSGGRTSYANAGQTRRDGVELSVEGALGAGWSYTVAANWIRARFEEDFSYQVARGGPPEARVVEAGNRIPGIPRADGFAELAWRSHNDRVAAAVELRASDAIPTDDLNSDTAPGNARVALRARWRPAGNSGWRVFGRIDNLLDREYVGSVIVNDGNGRFFEPGIGRSFTVGVGWNSDAR
ncbi:MAG: TonB-dependent receptor [Pseudomonadota bacterium]|nr:TonB-dependent receptor [Pseudomonadota bacterium]